MVRGPPQPAPASPPTEDVFPCKDCGIWYRSERNLQAHLLYYCASRQSTGAPATAADDKPKETYPNERVCPFPQCRKSCPSASSLEIHMRSHSGEPLPRTSAVCSRACVPPQAMHFCPLRPPAARPATDRPVWPSHRTPVLLQRMAHLCSSEGPAPGRALAAVPGHKGQRRQSSQTTPPPPHVTGPWPAGLQEPTPHSALCSRRTALHLSDLPVGLYHQGQL